jgi:hypothetical protein
VDVDGTVTALRYRDGRYAIITVVADGVELSCKGELDTVVVGMPFVGELEHEQPREGRTQGGDSPETGQAHATRRGSTDLLVVRVEQPPVAWARFAGVASYLRAGGVAALDGAVYQLVRTFGTDLPDVLLDAPERLDRIRALGSDLGDVVTELDKTRIALACAADLGEKGYEWLVGLCTHRYGPAGPVIASEDLGSIVADGVATARLVAGLASSSIDRAHLLGAGLSLERARSGWRGSTPRFASDYARSLFGEEGAGLVGEAVALGSLVRRGKAVVSAPDDGALRVVESEVARIVEAARPLRGGLANITAHRERSVVTNVSDSPVSLVETPPGASGAWLDSMLEHARMVGWAVSVLYPDRRGHLLGGWRPGQVVDAPDVVILVDAHQLDYDEMARRLLAVPSGCRLVVAGDRCSWAPGHGGNVVRELIATEAFPTVALDGSGAAWGIRCGESIERCVEFRYGRAPAGTPTIWSGGPASLSTRETKRVMLDRAVHDLGVGVLGTVVAADARARSVRVDLDGLEVADLSSSSLVGGSRIPVSHLPGVRTAALGLARAITPAQLYAAISAAKVLYVRDRELLHVDSLVEQKSVLLDLGDLARKTPERRADDSASGSGYRFGRTADATLAR